jgi:hypothetical protein
VQVPRRAADPARTGKDHFGLDHSQVRLYTSLMRHLVLAIAALAIHSVTAAATRDRTSTLPPAPIDPHFTRTIHDLAHHLHWAWWRRRHQARARWYHHRARLHRDLNPP